MGIAVAIITTASTFFIISTFYIIGSSTDGDLGSGRAVVSLLIASAVVGGAAWSLVLLIDWTVAGFRGTTEARTGDPRTSQYDLLYAHLLVQTEHSVAMTFAEVEMVLGFDLPPSARKYAAWWGNADPDTCKTPYPQAWLRAGRRAAVNLTAESVVFNRTD